MVDGLLFLTFATIYNAEKVMGLAEQVFAAFLGEETELA